jgi:hypothetical protein
MNLKPPSTAPNFHFPNNGQAGLDSHVIVSGKDVKINTVSSLQRCLTALHLKMPKATIR